MNNFSHMYNYIFNEEASEDLDKEVYATIAKLYGPDYSFLYSRQPDYIYIEDRREQDSVTFSIQQTGKGAGRINVEFNDPDIPGRNMFFDLAPETIGILRHYIINVKTVKAVKAARNSATRRNKEAIGQEIGLGYDKISTRLNHMRSARNLTRLREKGTKIPERPRPGQSGKPGRGPANNIRRYLGVQPPIDYLRTPIQENYNRSTGNLLHKSSYYHTPRYIDRSGGGQLGYKIDKSPIHGVGVFALRDFSPNEKVFKDIDTIISVHITKPGSKINHCATKVNTKLIEEADGWWIITTKGVKSGEEFTVNYNNLPPFLAKAHPSWKQCGGSRRSRRRRQRGGAVVYTPLEGRAIGDPDALPTLASEGYYRKDGYSDYPASYASQGE